MNRHLLDVTKAGFFFELCLCLKKGHCLLQGLSWIFEGRCKFHLLKEMLWSPLSETFGIEPDCPLFATERWIAFIEFFRHFYCIWTHLLLKCSFEFVHFFKSNVLCCSCVYFSTFQTFQQEQFLSCRTHLKPLSKKETWICFHCVFFSFVWFSSSPTAFFISLLKINLFRGK